MSEPRATVLIVDDEEIIREGCRQILERSQCRVETAADGVEGLRSVHLKSIDLVVLDLKMPGLDGVEFLRKIKGLRPDLDVIVITGYSSVESAVECMQIGAYDYLPKPFDAESLRLAVRRALEKRRLAEENATLRRRLSGTDGPAALLTGRSHGIQRVRDLVEAVAGTDTTVLLLGESGTGKELVARAIHQGSPRRTKPFLTVDCGAMVETLTESELFGHVKGAFTGAIATKPGRFELAEGGTLFLDEVANMTPTVQSRLLRVIQEREVTRVGSHESVHFDARLITATNQDLGAAIREGRFREDLYYRISVVQIEIPPLRDRRDDIPLLASVLIGRITDRLGCGPKRLVPEAVQALVRYDWPGNVRELENKLERALILSKGTEIGPDEIQFDDASMERFPEGGAASLMLGVVEAEHVRRVLGLTGWRMGRAASLLGIDRKTLWRKIRHHRIRRNDGA